MVDGHDGRTRDLIVRRLLEHGPTTASELAGELGLSGAAVRRHLDALIADKAMTSSPISTSAVPKSSSPNIPDAPFAVHSTRRSTNGAI